MDCEDTSSGTNVGGRRSFCAGATGLLAIAAMYFFASYFGMFDDPAERTGSDWQRKYWTAVSKADTASYAEDWDEVARQYEKINVLLPYSPACRYNRATALARLGRAAESLAELRLSVEFGWADVASLKSNPVLEDVRNVAGFPELIERATAIAREPLVIYVPASRDDATPSPLIITFHGLGENPHSHIQSWKQAADEMGAVVVAPRGNKPVGNLDHAYSFRWELAQDADQYDRLAPFKHLVEQSVELAKQRASIDDNRILLAGYSQGGSVALALLADAPERFCGAVLQATSYRAGLLEKWTRSPPENSLRVCVVVHEFDRMRQEGEEAFRAMNDLGIVTQLIVVAGADHEIPLGNSTRQVKSIRFVLGSGPAKP